MLATSTTALTAAALRRWRRSVATVSPLKPFYITTPIFYPNSAPHIGHLFSLVVADIFARFQRLLNPSTPVYLLTGTDDHGFKIQKAASSRGLPPAIFCDIISEQFRKLATKATISNSTFIRTSEPRHHEAVQHVWRRLISLGLIYKGSYIGWYSISDECFYSTAQITRTSHSDGSEAFIASETGSAVERMEEVNYMFRLSSFREVLSRHYVANPSAVFPPKQHAEVLNMLSLPLEDLSISRPRARLTWGVGVPDDPEQTIYVWFDALISYLTALRYPWSGADGTVEGWPVDLQIIGKDILRFHAIYFPAMLTALSMPLQRTLLTHAHWTIEQKKMSKSIGNVADPFEAMESFGVDVVRYYLARVGGKFRDDIDWSEAQLQKHSQEIQSLLGNFYLRTTSAKITALAADAAPVPFSFDDFDQSSAPENVAVLENLKHVADDVQSSMEKHDVAEALQHIVNLLRQANHAFTALAPWSRDPQTARASQVVSLEALRVCGICLQPFVPTAAKLLLDALEVLPSKRTWEWAKKRDERRLVGDTRVVQKSSPFFEVASLKGGHDHIARNGGRILK